MSCSRHLIAWAIAWMLAGAMVGCGPGRQEAKPPPDPSTTTGAFEVGDEPLVAAGDETLMTLTIEGMHCEGCASGIGRTLAGMLGVRKARVSFAHRTAWLLADRDQEPQTAAVVAALAKLGYQAAPAGHAPPPVVPETAAAN